MEKINCISNGRPEEPHKDEKQHRHYTEWIFIATLRLEGQSKRY